MRWERVRPFAAAAWVLFLLGLTTPVSFALGSRTRSQAIALYQSTFTNASYEFVMAPQFSVTAADSLLFAIDGTSVAIPEPSWILYVDLSPNDDFEHPTQVFLVPVDDTNFTIPQFDGDSWILVNGTSFYSDTASLSASLDLVSGSFPSNAVCSSAGGGLPGGSGIGNTWGVIVSGSMDKRHQNANPKWLMESHPDVTAWCTLGLGGAGIPTVQDICDKLDALAQMQCDKVYFIFTGHGSHKRCGMVLDNGAGAGGISEVLTGQDLACKLAALNAGNVCVVLNCCFAEKFLDDICPKLQAFGIPSSGVGGTCAWKTGKACECFSHFAKFYHECVMNPVPGMTLKECIDAKFAAAQMAAEWKPWCYQQGGGGKSRSPVPQESKFQTWVVPKQGNSISCNGSGVNFRVLTNTSAGVGGNTNNYPVIGKGWRVTLNCSAAPVPPSGRLTIFRLSFPGKLPVPLNSKWGQVLVFITAGTGQNFIVPLPASKSASLTVPALPTGFQCFQYAVQGFCPGGPGADGTLSNALLETVGTQ